jgi:hypothetical protein
LFQSALLMASVMRGSNPGPGTTAAAWNGVFAYRAAMHPAGKMPVEEPISGSCESGAFSPAPWRRRHNENGHGIVKGLPRPFTFPAAFHSPFRQCVDLRT